jgi:phosphinothricin acetyltransferase
VVNFRNAVPGDAAAVTSIYNQGIAARGATFDTQLREVAEIETRISDGTRYPLVVAVDNDPGLGWAGLSAYRARDCYAGIAEFSVYVDEHARGRGLGKQLLEHLIDAARQKGFWKLVSRIFPFNKASRSACRAVGFREVGTYEKHAALDGKWLDVVIVERLIPENLKSPALPAKTAVAL